MKITSVNNMQGVARPAEIAAKNKVERAARAVDTYQPTALAGEFNLARRAILATPDIRTDRVDDVARRISAGEYAIANSDLAEKIIALA